MASIERPGKLVASHITLSTHNASPLHRFIHPPPIVHSPYFTMSSVQIDAHRVAAPASADSLPPLPPLQILVDVAGASSEHLSSVEQLHQQNVLKAQQRMRGSAPSQSQGMFGTVMMAEFANLMISCIVSIFIEPVSSKKKRNAATKRSQSDSSQELYGRPC